MSAFDTLLQQAIHTPGLLGPDFSLDEERKQFDKGLPPPGPSLLLSLPPISARAIQMIVTFEVTSEAAYNRLYTHPIWPHGSSGVTIGIGYDCGYVTAEAFAKDWTEAIGAAAVSMLKVACGKTGAAASQILGQVQAVSVPYDAAYRVFKQTDIPRYTARTLGALPSAAAQLSPDCLGALVSLVFNRGASFNAHGDRYREMNAIRDDIASQKLADIPSQIRAMKRLWQGNPAMVGLLKRRDLEAQLFQEGLQT
ncbi:hypothetical protein BLA39750_02330 [Burkholderia lata]|uniref:Pesticin C-terminal domain-containing protein n=1 Tax=Burkholderia lata (strain ATCC 17760 / DSM 23089 / LMG 22485 / NCIMB 9086 / R18194 / 383) TaxID=482957 RepID=A0A6P2WKZ7_BURL3|nr:hypothetical protein [Burkholderia lata]VWC97652.1 hypothetical protein BLA39750_02330 [Burkholderia lata]